MQNFFGKNDEPNSFINGHVFITKELTENDVPTFINDLNNYVNIFEKRSLPLFVIRLMAIFFIIGFILLSFSFISMDDFLLYNKAPWVLWLGVVFLIIAIIIFILQIMKGKKVDKSEIYKDAVEKLELSQKKH